MHLCWFHAAKRLLGNFKQPHAVLTDYVGNFQKVRECLGRDEKPRHTSQNFFFPTSNFVNFYYQIKTLIFQCV